MMYGKYFKKFHWRQSIGAAAMLAAILCLLTATTAQADLMTGLQLYSPMDDIDVVTGDVPDVQNDNDGTLVGTATKVTDTERGDVLGLTAIGDRVLYDNTVDPGTSSYTAALWFKMTDTGSSQMLATQGANDSSVDKGWAMLYSGGYLYCRASYSSNSDNRLQIRHAFDDFGQWHHLAFQIDQTNGVIKAYLDGKGSGLECDQNGWEISKGLTFTSGESFTSAKSDVYDSLALGLNKTYQSNVRIDDFSIWTRGLTDSEIGTLAVPEPSSLVLVVMGIGSLLIVRRK